MPELSKEVLISEKEIAKRVDELAEEISNRQNGRPLLVVGILKGSFIFLADLVRRLTCPVTLEFIRVLMKDEREEGSPRIIKYDVPFTVEGKDVLIVEDIFDTGITIDYLLDHFANQSPASTQVCVLLDKTETHKVDVNVDYVGFEIPNKYVIGYGLDFEEKYRDLPYISWLDNVTWPLSS